MLHQFFHEKYLQKIKVLIQMVRLCHVQLMILKIMLIKARFLHMDDVYHYYETICIDTNELILLSYLSRKYIFKENVLVLIGGVYDFHALGVHD